MRENRNEVQRTNHKPDVVRQAERSPRPAPAAAPQRTAHETVDNAKVLVSVASAAAYLVRERIIAPENYEKCLRTWISKHANNDQRLLKLVSTALAYDSIIVGMPRMMQ